MAYNDISLCVCVATNNLEGCYENYVHTTARWAEYWWNGVVTIYNQDSKWQEKYTLIIETRTLVNAPYKPSDIYSDYHLPTVEDFENQYSAYLVYINKGNKNIYSKVGYSAKPSQRFSQLEFAYDGHSTVVPKAIYYFDNQGAAETMENFMREYFKKKYFSSFIQRDRFTDICFYEEDIEIFEKKAQLIEELFSF